MQRRFYNMAYKAMIGLEMHCEFSETNSKVFSSARNSYSVTPNENIVPYDMGFPGVLPHRRCLDLGKPWSQGRGQLNPQG